MTGQDYSVFEDLKVSKEQVIACSYSNWYRKFRPYVAKSIVIKPLPDEFIEYLSSESIRLPQENKDEVVADSDNEYSDWSDDEEDAQTNPTERFSGLHEEIKNGIRHLGSKVSPKLNWSAPKDAKWIMANNTTKCEMCRTCIYSECVGPHSTRHRRCIQRVWGARLPHVFPTSWCCASGWT